MSRPQPPQPNTRKSSAPWERLRPVRQDSLEAMGFVSKGDRRLLDWKTQEIYYRNIVDRYMQFCAQHSRDLDHAFRSLSLNEPSASSDPTTNPPIKPITGRQTHSDSAVKPHNLAASRWAPASAPAPVSSVAATAPPSPPPPENELSAILMALRKLREGLLATSSTASSPTFSQRVHVFGIRAAILALHPPSYYPSLTYLLSVLHTAAHPLSESELREMTSYMILDLALRQNDFIAAYTLKQKSAKSFHYLDRNVDRILAAVVSSNWVAFWRVRRQVDGHLRALMHWHLDALRKTTLKAFGRAYLKVDRRWLLKSTSGNEMGWDELAARESVGWSLQGDTIVIRKPKLKT